MANGVACDEGYARLRGNFSRWRVPSAIIDDLVDHRSAVSYPRGAMVFLEGSPGDLFGCVLAGYVKVYCNTANGARVLARLSGPGDIIGYADAEDCKGRRSKIFETQALTKCSIALFTRERAVRLLRSLDARSGYRTLSNAKFVLVVRRCIGGRVFSACRSSSDSKLCLSDLGRRVGVHDNRGTLIIPGAVAGGSGGDDREFATAGEPAFERNGGARTGSAARETVSSIEGLGLPGT